MKVFVRASDLAGEKPVVIAFYPDDSNISNNAHGDGMTVLTLPADVIVKGGDPSIGMPYLAKDWRQRAGSAPFEAEAKRRIEEAFTLEDRVYALHEMFDLMTKHGVDVARWPPAARERKATLDEKWNYVNEVKQRARTQALAPNIQMNPDNEKLWPRRLAKKG